MGVNDVFAVHKKALKICIHVFSWIKNRLELVPGRCIINDATRIQVGTGLPCEYRGLFYLEAVMHIPDGMLSAPVAGGAWILAAGGLALAVRKTHKSLGEQQIPILGVTAAFIYAAQMLKFPVLAGTSGHFLGAFLAAVLLGPWAGFLVISLVLIVQCLLHGDGGLGALGANMLNMGGVGALLTYAVFSSLKKILPFTKKRAIASAGIAAWASVFLASALCSLEVVISGNLNYPPGAVFGSMLGVHALIGVGEAIITVSVLSLVLASRPDLVTGIKLDVKAQEV